MVASPACIGMPISNEAKQPALRQKSLSSHKNLSLLLFLY